MPPTFWSKSVNRNFSASARLSKSHSQLISIYCGSISDALRTTTVELSFDLWLPALEAPSCKDDSSVELFVEPSPGRASPPSVEPSIDCLPAELELAFDESSPGRVSSSVDSPPAESNSAFETSPRECDSVFPTVERNLSWRARP